MARFNKGFSLYELLLTLSVAAVLIGVGLPSFAGTLARARISAEINALFHAVHVARKESIMRREVVTLCPSVDGHGCHPARDWSRGWIMFNNRDADAPPERDPGEPLLQVHFVDDRG